MLFIKELKKVYFSFVYVLFIGLLLFSWYENFYGVTKQEISASQDNLSSVYSEFTGGSLLKKPEKNADSYGMKNKEVSEKIMSGGTDMLIIEFSKNSYSTYPYSYYKEIVLSDKEQQAILEIISEITGLDEKQIRNLPDNYFPDINGNIIHFGADIEQNENGSFSFEMGDHDNHAFIPQVSYKRFKELMAEAESIIGKGSNYSMENLLQYYGLSEVTYDEAIEEYNKTIYDDKVSNAFARLFCDYTGRAIGLYPVFAVVIFWLKDRRNRMHELIDSKQTGTAKLIVIRFFAMLTAVMLPVVLLSMESFIPLISYSEDTGIAIDMFAFIKYIMWWLLPTAMIVTSLGMFLTILTSTPLAVLVQFIWWFVDTSVTGLSGDTTLFTLMIRHNTLNGSEIIHRNFTLICLNRGLFVCLALVLMVLSIIVYDQKRGGRFNYAYFLQKHFGFFKNRFRSYIQK